MLSLGRQVQCKTKNYSQISPSPRPAQESTPVNFNFNFMNIEVNPDGADETFFKEDNIPFARDTENVKMAQEQLVVQIKNLMQHQEKSCAFSVLVTPKMDSFHPL